MAMLRLALLAALGSLLASAAQAVDLPQQRLVPGGVAVVELGPSDERPVVRIGGVLGLVVGDTTRWTAVLGIALSATPGRATFEVQRGTRPASRESVAIVAGHYASFRAWVGVDPAPSRFADGTAVFQVFADGRKLFESPVMKADTPAQHVEVELGNANVLRLIVTYVGAYADHVNWAEAELVPAVPTADLAAEAGPEPQARRVDSGA